MYFSNKIKTATISTNDGYHDNDNKEKSRPDHYNNIQNKLNEMHSSCKNSKIHCTVNNLYNIPYKVNNITSNLSISPWNVDTVYYNDNNEYFKKSSHITTTTVADNMNNGLFELTGQAIEYINSEANSPQKIEGLNTVASNDNDFNNILNKNLLPSNKIKVRRNKYFTLTSKTLQNIFHAKNSNSLSKSTFFSNDKQIKSPDQLNKKTNNSFKHESTYCENDKDKTLRENLQSPDKQLLSSNYGKNVLLSSLSLRKVKNVKSDMETLIQLKPEKTRPQTRVNTTNINLNLAPNKNLAPHHNRKFVIIESTSPSNAIKITDLQNSFGFFPTQCPKRRKSSAPTKFNTINGYNINALLGKRIANLQQQKEIKTKSELSTKKSHTKTTINRLDLQLKLFPNEYDTNNNINIKDMCIHDNSSKQLNIRTNNLQVQTTKNEEYCKHKTKNYGLSSNSITMSKNRRSFLGISVIDYNPNPKNRIIKGQTSNIHNNNNHYHHLYNKESPLSNQLLRFALSPSPLSLILNSKDNNNLHNIITEYPNNTNPNNTSLCMLSTYPKSDRYQEKPNDNLKESMAHNFDKIKDQNPIVIIEHNNKKNKSLLDQINEIHNNNKLEINQLDQYHHHTDKNENQHEQQQFQLYNSNIILNKNDFLGLSLKFDSNAKDHLSDVSSNNNNNNNHYHQHNHNHSNGIVNPKNNNAALASIKIMGKRPKENKEELVEQNFNGRIFHRQNSSFGPWDNH